jgi:hypothetical protein
MFPFSNYMSGLLCIITQTVDMLNTVIWEKMYGPSSIKEIKKKTKEN